MLQHILKYLLIIFIYLLISPSAKAQESFRFFENKGQWDNTVKFGGSINSGKIYLLNNAIVYNFYDASVIDKHHIRKNNDTRGKVTDNIRMHALKIQFVNSNTSKISFIEKLEGNYNYFLSKNHEEDVPGVNAFGRIAYENLYPHIDLQYYSANGHVKYDFIVHPGATPEDIKMRYDGADSVFIMGESLHVKTSLGEIVEKKPYAFQVISGDTVEVACRFTLKDDVVSYKLPDGFNKDHALTIDPILIFSTYSGSSADNWGNTATYDENGNLYSGGIVFNPGFPVTSGAYQTAYKGNIDLGILKYDSTGSKLLYATYIGGSEAEIPHSLIVNNKNELLIFGTTSSTDFPVTPGAFQEKFGGGKMVTPMPGVTYINGSDIYIAKLNKDGSELLAATYLGGTENDGILNQLEPLTRNYGDQFRGDIITDSENNIHIASNTRSPDFPVLGAIQPSFNGGITDGVVLKISDDLKTILWSSYLGGLGMDAAFSIKLDAGGNIYVAGGTNSMDFPTTNDASRPIKTSDDIDGFVAAIKADGTTLLASTFIGTSSYDQVYFLDLDSQENIYVFGQTEGDIPVTSGLYHNPNGGQFLQKLNKSLTTLEWSTVFGSGGYQPNISPTAFLVNTCGNIFITGWGGSINEGAGYVGGSTYGMPITNDALQTETDGKDFYLMVLTEDVTELLYATYFGGFGNDSREHVDGGTSRFDKRGIVYHAVCAGCGGNSNFPSTPGVWSNTNNSTNCNNAAFKFDLATLRAKFSANINEGCPPLEVTFTNESSGGTTLTWDINGEVFKDLEVLTYLFEEPGIYTVKLTVEDDKTCIAIDQASKDITVYNTNFSVLPGDTICYGTDFQLSASGGMNYQWLPRQGLNNASIASPIASPDTTTVMGTWQMIFLW